MNLFAALEWTHISAIKGSQRQHGDMYHNSFHMDARFAFQEMESWRNYAQHYVIKHSAANAVRRETVACQSCGDQTGVIVTIIVGIKESSIHFDAKMCVACSGRRMSVLDIECFFETSSESDIEDDRGVASGKNDDCRVVEVE